MQVLDCLEDVGTESAVGLASSGRERHLVHLDGAVLHDDGEVGVTGAASGRKADIELLPCIARNAELLFSDEGIALLQADGKRAVALGIYRSYEGLAGDQVLRALADARLGTGGDLLRVIHVDGIALHHFERGVTESIPLRGDIRDLDHIGSTLEIRLLAVQGSDLDVLVSGFGIVDPEHDVIVAGGIRLGVAQYTLAVEIDVDGLALADYAELVPVLVFVDLVGRCSPGHDRIESPYHASGPSSK